MLSRVETEARKLKEYKGIITDELYQEIEDLSKKFKGLKVAHVNATPRGGGVAEILKALTPLMKGIGLRVSWHVIPPGEKFFKLTKEIHNALQGKRFSLDFSSRKMYQRYSEKAAEMMLDMNPDVWIIHDPQPVGVVQYLSDRDFYPLISRIHIDTTSPNPEAWNFIRSFLLEYDRVIFSTKEFVNEDISFKDVEIFSPAIDPLSEKNKPLPVEEAQTILKNFGIDVDRPVVSDILRFDPWKDPLGVVKSYRLAKKEIPDLQLALVGLFLARDDPRAARIYEEVKEKTKGDPDVHLFSDPNRLGSLSVDRFVNAFQGGSDVVIQKSIREGFGLVVTEAMWKGQPVIGGNAGGIKLQIDDGENGFLVSSPEEASKRIVELLKNDKLREKLGKEAKETVREHFLLPRLLKDYLELFKELDL